MITASLDKLAYYQRVIPSGTEIINYLNGNDIYSLKTGRYPISGESAFLLIQEYQTRSESERDWESHKKYIDIQIVLKGKEYMGYIPASCLSVKEPYNAEKDIIFYENDDKGHSSILVQEKYFCVFFPEDAHKPGYHREEECHVKKAIIKVLVLKSLHTIDSSHKNEI